MQPENTSFEQALSAEIVASERMRVQVLAAVLAFLLLLDQSLFLLDPDALLRITQRSVPTWLPLGAIGPFLLYEIVVLLLLRYRGSRGKDMPTPARFVNALIETSLPTVALWWGGQYIDPATVLGAWPSLVYFIFIAASTLRLDFALSAFTGAVAAAGYLGVAYSLLPAGAASEGTGVAPLLYLTRAGIMLLTGVVAGLVALRLRGKFRAAVAEAASRDRITNLFGQHVSPQVVERLLQGASDLTGETREICVMFLDIRNFTAFARTRSPEQVVDFLNSLFAFMIDAVDRHGGFINKFLGDGFMAVFGAPLNDPDAARNAVAAARDILTEIDRRALDQRAGDVSWPLRVGIGLHLGLAVTGNIGSPRRKEFTAIGDTVNLASRLEQLTKDHGARLIVSDAVKMALGKEADAATPLGAVTIKGYTAPVPAWRLD